MEITMYGTGSCRPLPKKSDRFRSFTGFGIKIGEDSLLFDIGPGAVYKMLINGIDILKEPTHLFISHFHPDHCSDIIPLMHARGNANRDLGGIKSLFVGGPEGTKDFFKDIFENVSKWKSFVDSLNIYKLLDIKEAMEGEVFSGKNWKVTCMPIKHFDGICFRLDAGGKSIVYSGDTGYDENIVKIGKGADVAIMECTFPDNSLPLGAHLSPQDVGKLAKLGEFKKVVLTHMLPACNQREEEMVAKIKEFVSIEVVVGYDFLKLEI